MIKKFPRMQTIHIQPINLLKTAIQHFTVSIFRLTGPTWMYKRFQSSIHLLYEYTLKAVSFHFLHQYMTITGPWNSSWIMYSCLIFLCGFLTELFISSRQLISNREIISTILPILPSSLSLYRSSTECVLPFWFPSALRVTVSGTAVSGSGGVVSDGGWSNSFWSLFSYSLRVEAITQGGVKSHKFFPNSEQFRSAIK